MNNNILILNNDFNKAKMEAKRYIIELSKENKKVILLDSFWSREKYSRFISSPYKENIEKRYHIKLSVEDFLEKENLVKYMNDRDVNIVKIKSIAGFMSAAELFPVIVSKLNTIDTDETIYLLFNDHILENLELKDIINTMKTLDKDKIKFIILTSNKKIGEELYEYISIT